MKGDARSLEPGLPFRFSTSEKILVDFLIQYESHYFQY